MSKKIIIEELKEGDFTIHTCEEGDTWVSEFKRIEFEKIRFKRTLCLEDGFRDNEGFEFLKTITLERYANKKEINLLNSNK